MSIVLRALIYGSDRFYYTRSEFSGENLIVCAETELHEEQLNLTFSIDVRKILSKSVYSEFIRIWNFNGKIWNNSIHI